MLCILVPRRSTFRTTTCLASSCCRIVTYVAWLVLNARDLWSQPEFRLGESRTSGVCARLAKSVESAVVLVHALQLQNRGGADTPHEAGRLALTKTPDVQHDMGHTQTLQIA